MNATAYNHTADARQRQFERQRECGDFIALAGQGSEQQFVIVATSQLRLPRAQWVGAGGQIRQQRFADFGSKTRALGNVSEIGEEAVMAALRRLRGLDLPNAGVSDDDEYDPDDDREEDLF